ncbi:PCP reductase family protein [Microbulbifer pacificus]|uniref:PCP reductase family protein n=1 Tax=Microbulbifer pacificus TaxID=407164 RepID=A0AAU0MVW7_9GAMM|nr:PCP reductase family protein [Microbulbifer pacificus]WOX04627.1 PCP reductase family protein [Microbulbifer pacificus]
MSESEIKWDLTAELSMDFVPIFVRGTVKKKVEAAARERGIKEITVDFIEEVRKEKDR